MRLLTRAQYTVIPPYRHTVTGSELTIFVFCFFLFRFLHVEREYRWHRIRNRLAKMVDSGFSRWLYLWYMYRISCVRTLDLCK